MKRAFPLLTFLSTILVWFACVVPCRAQQTAPTYELRGEVVNSATGKPVAGALVQLLAVKTLAQFSDSNGDFVFTGLPQGRFPLVAKKPGYFNDQELGRWRARTGEVSVPSDWDVEVQLMPEGIIYGQVTNEQGRPLERITIRLQRWEIVNGHKELTNAGGGQTDDQGNFRMYELRPGTYFLSFKAVNAWRGSNALAAGKKDEMEYGSEYYPGVADLGSATPIPITFGSHMEITQILTKQPTFEISGTVAGVYPAEAGINLSVLDRSGDSVQKMVRIDRSTGQFQIGGVPAGSYLLTATAWVREEGVSSQSGMIRGILSRTLQAYLPISVTSDMSGVVLTPTPGASIPIEVDDESSQAMSNPRQVMVRVESQLSQMFSRAVVAPRVERGQTTPAFIPSLAPGTYEVEASVNGPGYVAALTCGDADLLRDKLTVGTSGEAPPIQVTVRDDAAQLSGTVTENGQPAAAGVVIYSEYSPNRSVLARANADGRFAAPNLAPGTYQVIAVRDARDLEYRNPAVMENYIGRGTEVTLSPSGQSSVQVELPPASGGQP